MHCEPMGWKVCRTDPTEKVDVAGFCGVGCYLCVWCGGAVVEDLARYQFRDNRGTKDSLESCFLTTLYVTFQKLELGFSREVH